MTTPAFNPHDHPSPSTLPNITILGIESSCDETAAAVYNTEMGIIAHKLFSQTELHKQYGGVVPEIASRAQLEKINVIVDATLHAANRSLDDIDVVAVTNKPGLPGSLLVGLCFAKALAYAKNKKLVGVNHLEAHAFSAMIENVIPFPYICLTASGGHTEMYKIKDYGKYEVLGSTTDDAAGEAFDKVAKMLDLPYPGGPIIEKLASEVNFKDFFHYPRLKNKSLNFSFSGLKTAVLYDLVKKNAYNLSTKEFLAHNNLMLKKQVASSLLVCVADIFVDRIIRALEEHPDAQALAFVGGVAANNYIKFRLQTIAQTHNVPFFSPSLHYCTDNGAMVAFVGHYKAQQDKFDDLSLDLVFKS